MPKDHEDIFGKYHNGITIGDAITLYSKMISDPKYKSVTFNSAAHERMRELQILYNAGLRYFPKKKKQK
mgnify:CR=1 FL=1